MNFERTSSKLAKPTRGALAPATAESKEKIDRTVKHMLSHMREPLTRDFLASIAGLQQEHYSRIFKKHTGYSPLEYLTRIRIEEAKRLLRHSGESITEVARKVGFVDPYHFSRRFKQMVGVAPAYYAERRDRRVVASYGYGYLAALGVVPLAIDWNALGACPVPAGMTTGRLQAAGDRLSVQDFAAWSPDVILAASDDIEQEVMDMESCEVIVADPLQDPIYNQLPSIAGRLELLPAAEEWIARYEQRRDRLRTRIRSAIGDSRVAILRIREQGLQMYGMLNMGYPVYRSLGAQPPDKIKMQSVVNAYFHSSVIDPVELSFYGADYLFVILQPDDGAQAFFETLSRTEEWKRYSPVANGKVFWLDVGRWLSFDPVSIAEQMEEAARLLLGEGRHKHPSGAQ
ncbi:hypothetical protein B1748_09720 [Paenibacillus sp. MY03]|uniref:helix-turn-helix domain-containing protein n=1 Tax=Paenibacillus sp. MY03 TaxID=302980 RepID=UPI000B3CFA7F|nr:helix-turn-helix domain-containing protein [Paenibacillus sp. MY03]OUS76855.1 hypothetical protein B1748_09720 [Paenibacillus sp. MY03]